jgi:hypothetical protein
LRILKKIPAYRRFSPHLIYENENNITGLGCQNCKAIPAGLPSTNSNHLEKKRAMGQQQNCKSSRKEQSSWARITTQQTLAVQAMAYSRLRSDHSLCPFFENAVGVKEFGLELFRTRLDWTILNLY